MVGEMINRCNEIIDEALDPVATAAAEETIALLENFGGDGDLAGCKTLMYDLEKVYANASTPR